ncbi:MAG TPA: hypothetical protein VGQ64_07250 [Candidatus Limnocylindrales bacterium]|jgi:hypothetical protein|nr:hypothetical protein [Candidatus Limnocylindrales bacterium]
MTGNRPGLATAVEEAASRLEAIDRHQAEGVTAWSIGGIVFAALEPGTPDRAEFRLAPAVVAAALRTPDTARSPRGADWVAFAPLEVDGHAVDRATAWLESAWRRADGET